MYKRIFGLLCVLVSLLLLTGLTGAVKDEVKAAWSEDFEDNSTGSWPANWSQSGNADSISTNHVVGSPTFEGSRALQLKGVPGSCWESLAYHDLGVSTQESFTISLEVKTTTDGTEGCHSNRGGIQLATKPDWTENSRGLLKFNTDGTLSNDLGGYQVGKWMEIRIKYERVDSNTVKLSYWIDGDKKGTKTMDARDFENDLTYLGLTSGDFTIYYDDIEVKTAEEKDCVTSDYLDLNTDKSGHQTDITVGPSANVTGEYQWDENLSAPEGSCTGCGCNIYYIAAFGGWNGENLIAGIQEDGYIDSVDPQKNKSRSFSFEAPSEPGTYKVYIQSAQAYSYPCMI